MATMKRSSTSTLASAAHSDLARALRRRFGDKSRQLVVVVGSGFHRHLAGHGVSLPQEKDRRADLTSWNGLLRSIANTNGLDHEDPTATWESVVTSSSSTEHGPRTTPARRAPRKQEKELLRRTVARLMEVTPRTEQVSRFRPTKTTYRDIISLNFDRTIERALFGEEVPLSNDHERLHARKGPTRIWYPHGVADPKFAEDLQLGVRAYARAALEFELALDGFRGERREFMKHHESPGAPHPKSSGGPWTNTVRDLDRTDASWWWQLFVSDVAFIGCGLDRAELDLWLVLHERQRELARLQRRERPKAFFLHPLVGFPRHVASGPAGLIPVVTRDHDEAWELLFGKWWS